MTPELMPSPPEKETPEPPATNVPAPKSGFLQGALTTLAPGAGVIAGICYGAPAVALIGITAAAGIIGSAMAIKKKSNLIALGCLSAAVTGFGIAMTGIAAPLVAIAACGLGLSVAHRYAEGNKEISMPKLLSGAFLGASLSILGAAACIGSAPADQKQGLAAPARKTSLTPAFHAAGQTKPVIRVHATPADDAPALPVTQPAPA